MIRGIRAGCRCNAVGQFSDCLRHRGNNREVTARRCNIRAELAMASNRRTAIALPDDCPACGQHARGRGDIERADRVTSI
jgi:hypothetical protein